MGSIRSSLLASGVLVFIAGCGDPIVGPSDASQSDIVTQDAAYDSAVAQDADHDAAHTDVAHHADADHDAAHTDAAHADADHDAAHHTDAAHTCMTGDTVYTPSGPHWDYTHQTEWPMLMGSMCAGMTQTPIDIPMTTTPETTPLTFNNYGNVPLRLLNNGHTLQVNISTTFGMSDPSVTFNGTTYYLLQFHGHTTSEHTIRGSSYPMEFHFVHATNNTPMAQYLVVGVMFNMGADNAVIGTMLSENPGNECSRERLMTNVNLGAMIPSNRSHYHYTPGSLTTPPCTEGLNWFVMRDPLTVGMGQVMSFSSAVHGTNNRAVQPLNMRTVYQYTQM